MLLFKTRDKNSASATSFEKMTDSDIHSQEEFRKIIEKERARADRIDKQFSLIVLDVGSSNGNHHTHQRILQEISSRLRKIDEIGWYDRNCIGIILPYTAAQGAQRFAESLFDVCSFPISQCLLNVYTYGADKIGKNW